MTKFLCKYVFNSVAYVNFLCIIKGHKILVILIRQAFILDTTANLIILCFSQLPFFLYSKHCLYSVDSPLQRTALLIP